MKPKLWRVEITLRDSEGFTAIVTTEHVNREGCNDAVRDARDVFPERSGEAIIYGPGLRLERAAWQANDSRRTRWRRVPAEAAA